MTPKLIRGATSTQHFEQLEVPLRAALKEDQETLVLSVDLSVSLQHGQSLPCVSAAAALLCDQ